MEVFESFSETIITAFSDVVQNCIDIAVAIIPIGIGLIAIGKMWDVAKRFFNKSTSYSDIDLDFYSDYDSDYQEWIEDNANKDYDIDG